MYTSTNETPVTAQPHEVPGTGTGPQASTAAQAVADALQRYNEALLAYHEAMAARHRADEASYRALAHVHRTDPHITSAERLLLANACDERAEDAAAQGAARHDRAETLRRQHPSLAADAMAIVVVTIRRDRIEQTARLLMGAPATASRAWSRQGQSSWRSTDPEWSDHEDRIGVELAEFMDELPMPSRVAAMLPRPPAPGSDAARKAAEEVRRA